MVVVNGRQFEVVVYPDADAFKASWFEYVSDKSSRTAGPLNDLHIAADETTAMNEGVQKLVDLVESGQV
jgi:hypothetical protein